MNRVFSPANGALETLGGTQGWKWHRALGAAFTHRRFGLRRIAGSNTILRVKRELPAGSSIAAEIEWLLSLGPEAQDDIDESLLRDNLRLTPLERLEAANRAANAVEQLRAGLRVQRRPA
jgi:hypothetical protein